MSRRPSAQFGSRRAATHHHHHTPESPANSPYFHNFCVPQIPQATPQSPQAVQHCSRIFSGILRARCWRRYFFSSCCCVARAHTAETLAAVQVSLARVAAHPTQLPTLGALMRQLGRSCAAAAHSTPSPPVRRAAARALRRPARARARHLVCSTRRCLNQDNCLSVCVHACARALAQSVPAELELTHSLRVRARLPARISSAAAAAAHKNKRQLFYCARAEAIARCISLLLCSRAAGPLIN